MAIPLDPWQAAKDRYLEDLNDEEKALFNGASSASVEAFFYSASTAQKLHQSESKVRALAAKLKPLTDAVEEYGKAIDVLANASSLVLCPIWGSIRVILQLASEFGKYFEKLVDMLERIGDVIPRFRLYHRIFPHHLPLLHSLSIAYFDIINFCGHIKSIFRKAKRNSVLHPIKLLWRSCSGEFDGTLENFRNHRKNVEKDAGAAHMIEASESRSKTRENWGREQKRLQEDSRRHILDRLSTIDSRSHFEKLRKRRQIGTCEWLRHSEIYHKWHEDTNSGILSCHGIPGCGKSILSTKAIDLLSLEDSKDTKTVYFHCNYSDLESLKAAQILGALSRQLLEPIDIPPFVAEESCFSPRNRPLKSEEASRIFHSAVSLYSTVYVVLDGLDECSREDQGDVLKALKEETRITGVLFKVFASSREPTDISSSFGMLRTITINIANNSEDISAYVRGSVFSLRQSGRLNVQDEHLVNDIIQTLCEKAQGMFLWVAFQLEDICEAFSESDIRETLQNLPKDLAETYERILVRIQRSKGGDKKVSVAEKVFTWVICARRPLRMAELQEIVAFTPEDKCWDGKRVARNEKQLLRACGNLTVHNKDDDTVRLAHYTVQQYLISNPMKIRAIHIQLDLEEANRQLGELCVAYLSFSDFESQISTNVREQNLAHHTWAKSNALSFVGDSKKLTLFSWPLTLFGHNNVALPNINLLKYSKIQTPALTDLQQKYALLDYSITYWADHTKQFSPDKTVLWKTFKQLAMEKQRLFDFKPWNDRYSSRSYPFMSMFTWALETGHCGLLESLRFPPKGPNLTQYCDFSAASVGNAVHEAVRRGHLAAAEYLVLRYKFNLNPTYLIAAEENHLDFVRFLARHVERTQASQFYPLHSLAKSRRSLSAAVEIILESPFGNYYLNIPDDERRLPLYYAAENGHFDVVRQFLARGAKWNFEDPAELFFPSEPKRSEIRPRHERCPLSAATRRGQLDVVQQLLKAMGQVVPHDDFKRTALHWAARYGDLAIAYTVFGKSLELGVMWDVNDKDLRGRTPLHYAAMVRNLPLISFLHSLGADVNLRDEDGQVPRDYYVQIPDLRHLDFYGEDEPNNHFIRNYLRESASKGERNLKILEVAMQEKNHDVVRSLASGSPYVSEPGPREETVLYRAIEHGDPEMVKALLQADADVNLRCGVSRGTALHLAISARDDSMVQLLMDRKPDTAITDWMGDTPLDKAVYIQYENGIRILLKGGAYSGIGKDGKSPVHRAAEMGGLGALRAFLEGGADSSCKNKFGDTPLHILVKLEQMEEIRILLEHGADPGLTNDRGDTPLHLAAVSGFLNGVELLLKYVRDADEYDHLGWTPLIIAAEKNHREIEKKIRRHILAKGNIPKERGPVLPRYKGTQSSRPR